MRLKYCLMLIILIWVSIAIESRAQEKLLIQSATIIQPKSGQTIIDGAIYIDDGIIAAVGPQSEIQVPESTSTIDASGKWAIPGLIEVHTHSDTRHSLKQGLALGITTAHTLPGVSDSTLSLEMWASDPGAPYPRIIQNPWMYSQSFPDNIAPGYWNVVKPVNAVEAVESVEHVRELGFQEIKVFMDDGKLWFNEGTPTDNFSQSELQAITDRAHQLRMRVYAHTWQAIYFRICIDIGIDNIIHPAADKQLSSGTWKKMKRRNMTWTATMAGNERLGSPETYYRRILDDTNLVKLMTVGEKNYATKNVETKPKPYIDEVPLAYKNVDRYRAMINHNTLAAVRNGVELAVGSDCAVGIGTHIEMEMLQEAGLQPSQILRAATWGGALTLGLEDETGAIEVGKRADLVILNANPMKDIRNSRNVDRIVKEGVVYRQDELIESMFMGED